MSREHRYLSFGSPATKRFVAGCARFAIGLGVVLALSQVSLARYNSHSWGYRLIGREVFQAQRVAQRVEGQYQTRTSGTALRANCSLSTTNSDGVRSRPPTRRSPLPGSTTCCARRSLRIAE